jgi:hypothetical protein
LEIFQKHFAKKVDNEDPKRFLGELYEELRQEGCVKEGWWDTILQDVEYELANASGTDQF